MCGGGGVWLCHVPGSADSASLWRLLIRCFKSVVIAIQPISYIRSVTYCALAPYEIINLGRWMDGFVRPILPIIYNCFFSSTVEYK